MRLRIASHDRRPDERRDERGHTLMELMVATALLSLITAAAFGAVIVMQNQAVKTTDRFTAESEAQTIADRIAKDIRTAVAPSTTTAAFESASANDVTFYANLSDNGPTKLHAYTSLLAGTSVYVFHEDATQPDAGGTVGNYSYLINPSVSRLDGRYLDTTSGQPMFRYYDKNSVEIPSATLATLAGRRSIDQVAINLRVRVHPGSPIVVINTLVHVRSVDYNPNS